METEIMHFCGAEIKGKEMKIQMLKNTDNGFRVFDIESKEMYYAPGNECEWYEYTETDEVLALDKLKCFGQKQFKETYCGNPKEWPAIKHARAIGSDLILMGESTSISEFPFRKILTWATFYTRK